jgi:D-glycero-D-manno-heptose 1,7-bisphosphate phosphatase
MNKCIFLDRDGVINKDKVDYVYKVEDVNILEGVAESLKKLKKNGYLLVVITNQSGIDKGVFTHEDVSKVHTEMQNRTGNLIDEFYYSPYHRTLTNSLATKPGSLMFEKAITKYKIDINQSWMVGDRVRDLIPAISLGIKPAMILGDYPEEFEGIVEKCLLDIVNKHILKN